MAATVPPYGLPWLAMKNTTAPNTAPSAIRSIDESSSAPNLPDAPRIRAIVPSSASVSAKKVTTSAPVTR